MHRSSRPYRWIWRAIRALLVGGLVVAVAVVGAAVAFRDELAAWAIAAWLDSRGIALAATPQVDVGLRRAVISGLRAQNAALSVDRVAATYSVHGLITTERAETLVVAGLSARGRIGPNGTLEIAGLPERGGANGAGLSVDPPFETLTLTDAHIALGTPAGTVDLAVAARARAAGGDLALAGIVGAVGEAGTLSASFEGRAGRDGSAEVFAAIEDGALESGALEVTGIEGWLTAAFAEGDLVSGSGALTAVRISGGGATFAPVEVLFVGVPLPHLVLVRARGPGASHLAADASSPPDRPGAPVAVTADLALPSLAAALAPLVDPPPADAAVRLQLDAVVPSLNPTGPLRLPPPASWAGEGRVRLRADRAWAAGLFRDGAASVDTAMSLDGQRLRLDGRSPWRLSAVPEALGEPVALTLAEAAAAVGWGESPEAQLDGRLALTVGGVPEPAEGRIDLAISGSEEGWRVDSLDLELAGGALELGEMSVRPGRLTVDAAGAPADFAAEFGLDLGVDGRVTEALTVRAGRVDLAGRLSRAGDRLALDLDGCLGLSADGLAIGQSLRLPRGLSVCVEAASDPPLAVSLRDGQPASWQTAVAARDLTTSLDTGGEIIDLAVPSLRLEGEGEATGDSVRATLSIRDGDLALPRSDVAVDAIDATLVATSTGDPSGDLMVRGARLRLTGTPPLVVPVRLTGSGRVDDWRSLVFSASGIGADGALRLDGEGVVSLTGGGGRLEVEVAPIAFAPEVLNPGDVFPVLTGTPILSADGTVAGTVRYGWGAMRRRGAEVRFDDLGLVTDYGAMTGINATLSIDRFVPLVVPPAQTVTIEGVDIGLLFEDGEIVFGIPDGRRLDVLAAKLDWLGGVVTSDPFTISLDDPERTVTLRASGVELDGLLGQIPLSGLSATGTLRGVVPLRLTGDTIRIDDAVLEASGPGTIRYRPEGALPDFGDDTGSVELLLEAAENFHYEDLSLTVSGRTGDALSARLRLVGGNPDLYDGYPVALNVNLEGALDEILRRGIAVSRIGDRFDRLPEGVVTDDIIEELERLGQ